MLMQLLRSKVTVPFPSLLVSLLPVLSTCLLLCLRRKKPKSRICTEVIIRGREEVPLCSALDAMSVSDKGEEGHLCWQEVAPPKTNKQTNQKIKK